MSTSVFLLMIAITSSITDKILNEINHYVGEQMILKKQKNTKLSNKSLGIGLSLIFIVMGADIVSSQTVESLDIAEGITLGAMPFNPPNEGEPIETVGGGSRRGFCLEADLANITFQKTQSTLTANLPAGMAEQVFFSLRDSLDNTIHQGFLPVNNNQASIPDDILSQTSTTSQPYTWSMAIICGEALAPDSPVFRGSF